MPFFNFSQLIYKYLDGTVRGMTNDQPPYPQYPEQQYPEQQYPADQSAYQPYPPQQYAPPRQRPLGVTILAILAILGGLLNLLGALGSFALAALIGTLVDIAEIEEEIGSEVPEWVLDNAALYFGIVGVLALIAAVLMLILGWTFLKGKKWARILAIVLLVFSVVSSIVSSLGVIDPLSIGVSVIIPVLVLVYLYLPSSKAWFTQ